MLQQKRIGQMPRLFEHGYYGPDRTGLTELDRGNSAFADAVIEIFKEGEGSPLPRHREWVGIEAMGGAGQIVPGRTRQIARTPNALVVGVAPADPPMRRIAAETIDPLQDRDGESAKDIGSRRFGTRLVEAVDFSRHRPRPSRENCAEQGPGPRHRGVERAAQSFGDFGGGPAGIQDLAADLVAYFDHRQIA